MNWEEINFDLLKLFNNWWPVLTWSWYWNVRQSRPRIRCWSRYERGRKKMSINLVQNRERAKYTHYCHVVFIFYHSFTREIMRFYIFSQTFIYVICTENIQCFPSLHFLILFPFSFITISTFTPQTQTRHVFCMTTNPFIALHLTVAHRPTLPTVWPQTIFRQILGF